MADRYTIRLLDKEGRPKTHIWLEYQCPNQSVPGTNACIDCVKKYPGYKYQSNPKCDHGIVGGPYTADSKLYGSPYYESYIKKGYTISKEDELRAKEAIHKASSEMPIKKSASAGTITTTSTISAVLPIKAPKKPRKKKSTTTTPIILTSSTPEHIQEYQDPAFIESMEVPPINTSNVIVVKVKKILCENDEYYLDPLSGKVYEVLPDGVGNYRGRCSLETQIIDPTYPDSDEE